MVGAGAPPPTTTTGAPEPVAPVDDGLDVPVFPGITIAKTVAEKAKVARTATAPTIMTAEIPDLRPLV